MYMLILLHNIENIHTIEINRILTLIYEVSNKSNGMMIFYICNIEKCNYILIYQIKYRCTNSYILSDN